jgi:hypothetical protein
VIAVKILITLILVGLLHGCEPLQDLLSSATGAACPADVISFSQEDGCIGDDTFEFCIPADNPFALEQVQAIAPAATCSPGRGRAGCKPESELLCMVRTSGLCLKDDSMTAEGWQLTCDLAGLPFIEAIVPTFYE